MEYRKPKETFACGPEEQMELDLTEPILEFNCLTSTDKPVEKRLELPLERRT